MTKVVLELARSIVTIVNTILTARVNVVIPWIWPCHENPAEFRTSATLGFILRHESMNLGNQLKTPGTGEESLLGMFRNLPHLAI